MSMLRSMDSAVTGLKNHQVRMDIIGNNIANVNTVGFKGSRVTFEESMSQLLQGSSRPPGESGGKNPIQVGLGMGVGSIDTKFTQGNLESTGQATDIAIEGDAFFGVSNGEGVFYTRNGAFQLDATGKMVLPTNGYVLQGKTADLQGNFPVGTVISDIVIPLNEQAPAQATTQVNFGRNLDADSQAIGSAHYSQRFLHYAQPVDSVLSMSDSSGQLLNIAEDDVLTFSGSNALGVEVNQTYIVQDGDTIQNILTAIQVFMQSNVNGLGAAGTRVELITPVTDPDPADANVGAITVYNNAATIQNFQVTSSNPIYGGRVTKAFSIDSTIPAGSALGTFKTDFLRSPAQESDLLAEIYTATGGSMGLENGDEITVFGKIGTEAADNVTPLVYNAATTRFSNLITKIKDNFKLPERDLANSDNLSVSLNLGGSDDNIPDGSLVIRGIPGDDFALESISIRASNSNNANPAPLDFNSNLAMTLHTKSRSAQVYDSSITVFDQSGDDHVLTVTFAPTLQPGHWRWTADLTGNEIPLSGNQGDLLFDQDGSVSSFTFDDNSTEFAFDPNNGSDVMRVNLNVGGPGNFRGLTQFRAATTAAMIGQDGYGTGELKEISIGDDGTISGIFSNGVNKPLAKIMLVDFINPAGLVRVSDSVFAASSNSGDAIFVQAGDQTSMIKPGALEISNIELASEFTDMITTQRGYQANARAITTSDTMLEELVNLKR